jgi:hypothetical protein
MQLKSILAIVTLSSAIATTRGADFWLGDSSVTPPTSIPIIDVPPGGSISLSLWAQAEGPGFLQNASVGIYQSSVPTFAGGLVSAANVLPASANSAFSSPVTAANNQYASNITSEFALSRLTPTNPSVTGASLVLGTIGGANSTSAPPSPITSSAPKLIDTITAVASSSKGRYYLYLGRTGSGIGESPAFKAPTFIGPANATNTAVFGFGDTPVAVSGTGTSANTLGPNADAIIEILFDNPTLDLSPSVTAPKIIPGSGKSYATTALDPNLQFMLAGTPDPSTHTLVALDFSGITDSFFFPIGGSHDATQLFGPDADAILAQTDEQLGGTYDMLFDLGPSVPQGALSFTHLSNNGVTLNAVAIVVPEPAALICAIPAFLLLRQRTRLPR